jgi:hypothetical protein
MTTIEAIENKIIVLEEKRDNLDMMQHEKLFIALTTEINNLREKENIILRNHEHRKLN